jgi:hypothetical protein
MSDYDPEFDDYRAALAILRLGIQPQITMMAMRRMAYCRAESALRRGSIGRYVNEKLLMYKLSHNESMH